MIETENLEQNILKTQKLLKWFETEANIDRALSSEEGPVELRKRAGENINQLRELIRSIKNISIQRCPEKNIEIEESYASAIESLEAFAKIIGDN